MQYFKFCPLPCRTALQQFADCSSLTFLCHDDRQKTLFTFYVVWINTKVDILYSNCSHITFELDWVFILNFGSFFLLLRLQNIFSF